MACADEQNESKGLKDDLVACVSCRASYHRACAKMRNKDDDDLVDWTCPVCSSHQDQVRLKRWSLELVQQQDGRLVPMVRGVRCDKEAPSGSLWRTSEIIHAVTPRKLVTRTWVAVRLVGPLHRPLARKLGLPGHLADSFQSGFPVRSWLPPLQPARRRAPPPAPSAPSAAPAAADRGPAPTSPLKARHGSDTAGPAADKPTSPRGRGEEAQAARKRPWMEEDTAMLQKSLRDVRPSAPHYWQQVAAYVGQPAAECQARALGSAPGSRHRCGAATRHAGGDGARKEAPPTELGPVPKKDGPRRAQRIRTFLNARCFGEGRDFLHTSPSKLQQGATPMSTPPKATLPEGSDLLALGPQRGPRRSLAGALASPASAQFLGSLHTGCTPTSGRKARGGIPAQFLGMSPLVAPRPGAAAGSVLDGDEDDDAGGAAVRGFHLDLGDSTWQPIGLDSFICEARDRRRRLARYDHLRSSARSPCSLRPTARAKLRRASGLFKKLKTRTIDETPKSVASESEDEMAPVAEIPLHTGEELL